MISNYSGGREGDIAVSATAEDNSSNDYVALVGEGGVHRFGPPAACAPTAPTARPARQPDRSQPNSAVAAAASAANVHRQTLPKYNNGKGAIFVPL
uniref:Uncharacterized protein n=1 Tax=Plectus sambesii TaxID=2011161 RepID=A0A914XLI8_9BILA